MDVHQQRDIVEALGSQSLICYNYIHWYYSATRRGGNPQQTSPHGMNRLVTEEIKGLQLCSGRLCMPTFQTVSLAVQGEQEKKTKTTLFQDIQDLHKSDNRNKALILAHVLHLAMVSAIVLTTSDSEHNAFIISLSAIARQSN